MLSPEGRHGSRLLTSTPRFVTCVCLLAAPGCLLVQPLDEAKQKEDYAAGAGGTGASGGSGGRGGTGGKGGSTTGGSGGTAGKGGAAGRGGSDAGGSGGS